MLVFYGFLLYYRYNHYYFIFRKKVENYEKDIDFIIFIFNPFVFADNDSRESY